IHHGTEQQKQRFLRKILTGDEMWCQGFSEPNAGSDLAAVRTRAELRGDAFHVSGQKIWTSYARFAEWCILVTRTDFQAPKHKGITFLLVDTKSPGITIRPLVEMTGVAWFNEVFFDDVRVPRENVVGEVNGGWTIVITTLAHERSGSAPHARLQGEMRDVLDLARRVGRDGRTAGAGSTNTSGRGRRASTPAPRRCSATSSPSACSGCRAHDRRRLDAAHLAHTPRGSTRRVRTRSPRSYWTMSGVRSS